MRNIPAETQRQSSVMDTLVAEIRSLMDVARTNVIREVNTTMLYAYWQIGRIIVEGEQNGKLKAQYGAKLIPELSKRLTKELGRGYSRFNLQYMRLLYCEYPSICRTASCKLTWSHYIELLSVEDRDARAFNERECENARWSVKELNRQIGTSLFERLLLSNGKANKDIVAEYALGGLSNQVFASRYVYYIPDKDTLVSEVKSLLEGEK